MIWLSLINVKRLSDGEMGSGGTIRSFKNKHFNFFLNQRFCFNSNNRPRTICIYSNIHYEKIQEE